MGDEKSSGGFTKVAANLELFAEIGYTPVITHGGVVPLGEGSQLWHHGEDGVCLSDADGKKLYLHNVGEAAAFSIAGKVARAGEEAWVDRETMGFVVRWKDFVVITWGRDQTVTRVKIMD